MTERREFAPIDNVKFSLPLTLAVAAIAMSLNACVSYTHTLATRRSLYEPAPVEGPYTDQLAHIQVKATADKAPVPPKSH